MHWTFYITSDKNYRNKINESFKETSYSKFCFSISSRVMHHRNFRHRITLPLCQHGDITMKLTINSNIFNDFLFISFQAAIEVVNFYSADNSSNKVEKF